MNPAMIGLTSQSYLVEWEVETQVLGIIFTPYLMLAPTKLFTGAQSRNGDVVLCIRVLLQNQVNLRYF